MTLLASKAKRLNACQGKNMQDLWDSDMLREYN